MKVGILTHHYIKNYGAFLQTFALQETLKKQYPDADVYVINFINVKHNIINILGWYRFNRVKDSLSSYFKKITIPRIFKKVEKNYLKLTAPVYNVDDINKMNFDLIVIGSDEVWNYEDKKSYHSVKFGYGLTCKNIITYAPSVGKTNPDNIVNPSIETGLRNIKKYSYRDDNTEKFLLSNKIKNAVRVLDPTFLYDFPNYLSDNIKDLKNEKYILIYYCDGLNEKMRKHIIDFARKNNYKIYGAGEYQKWFDNSFVAVNPFEWVEMFKYAQFVFTGTFHGTVFSIKYGRQFFNYVTINSRVKKVNSLLKQFNIVNRDINENNFNDRINNDADIDYKKVNLIIEKQKDCSLKYITDVR